MHNTNKMSTSTSTTTHANNNDLGPLPNNDKQQQQIMWLKYDDGLVSIPYPSSWQASRQNSILYFFSNIQLSTKNSIKDNVNVQIVISGEQSIDDLLNEVKDNLESLDEYQLLNEVQHGTATSKKLDSAWFRCRYKMSGESFKQITYVLDCGSGLKYLFTFTSSHTEMLSEPVFLMMLENALFRTIRDLPWHMFDCANCKIEYPQMWTRQSNGSTLLFFSPIQLVSQNKITDNVVAQYITNGMTLDHDITLLYQQLAERPDFKIIKNIADDAVGGNDAKMFHVEYKYNEKHLSQITYLVKQRESNDCKWMISYTSCGQHSKALFEEMLRRIVLKKV